MMKETVITDSSFHILSDHASVKNQMQLLHLVVLIAVKTDLLHSIFIDLNHHTNQYTKSVFRKDLSE